VKILVTGAAGRLGAFVLAELTNNGHRVVAVDRCLPESYWLASPLGIEWRAVEVRNVGEIAGALVGCDAVLHLAAIAAPTGHPPEVVFSNNVEATFAVLQAASVLGVGKAVIASSLSALGMAYAPEPLPPVYVPLDEQHPLRAADCYALSKEVDERTAQMFSRREGMSVVALRFPFIALPGEGARIADELGEGSVDTWARSLWSYIDVRDAALACRLAAESNTTGFEVINVAAADSLSQVESTRLVDRYCPEAEVRGPLLGCCSLVATGKAAEMLRFSPAHSWRDVERGQDG
jgi:nucleoside-diphosphate-sugar epimerase